MSEEPLLRVASEAARAVARVLGEYAPGEVETHGCELAPDSSSPIAALPAPGACCLAAYADGVGGANILAISAAGARRLAGNTTGDAGDEPLGSSDVADIADILGAAIEAATRATGAALDMRLELLAPTTRALTTSADIDTGSVRAPTATVADFSVHGERCRLVQLMPHAFALRAQQALEALDEALGSEPAPDPGVRSALALALGGVDVRVSAELGRSARSLTEVLGLPAGSVLDLDRDADDPVDLYVNGERFALGRLVVGDDDRWAVRIETVLAAPLP
ncbi:MAG TPA: FliM/FliN family flagellar motor switch protein [Solirubrobacteraceae bacterium]|nr:FliM/FliN family flagellar motor switch protein [Solirubrobacteraceae bacterium]